MEKQVTESLSLLDMLSAMHPGASRTTLRQMLRFGRVRVNGEPEEDARRTLQPGDTVSVGAKSTSAFLPPELSIEYEDEHIIVVTKASGLLTVATPNEKDRTAQAYLNHYLKQKGYSTRIHVVHRLDRDTSGVLVWAKTMDARLGLKELFASHDIERMYVAIVEGRLESESGTFRSVLREDMDTYQVRSVNNPDRGKLAITHWRRVAAGDRYTVVEVTLETGRKNQIRVQFSEAGHPIVGDERYGAQTDPIRRLGLHAKVLGFAHPITGKKMRFEAPLPDSFRRLKL